MKIKYLFIILTAISLFPSVSPFSFSFNSEFYENSSSNISISKIQGIYDIKIYITSNKTTISQIFNPQTKEFQSSYYYIKNSSLPSSFLIKPTISCSSCELCIKIRNNKEICKNITISEKQTLFLNYPSLSTYRSYNYLTSSFLLLLFNILSFLFLISLIIRFKN